MYLYFQSCIVIFIYVLFIIFCVWILKEMKSFTISLKNSFSISWK